MNKIFFYSLMISAFFSFLLFSPVHAATNAATGLLDSDNDGIPDVWETQVFHTDPNKADTDGDGYPDLVEIENGYDPLNSKPGTKLKEADYDHDGLSDRLELLFGSDPTNNDTDGDGRTDGAEAAAGYNPMSSSTIKLKKHIEVNLAKQILSYYLGKVEIGQFITSTGTKAHPTPKGTFVIANKSPNAWSHSAKLWMPYWMGLKGMKIGIHELPYWPDGRVEGEKDLGHPASGGCIRLGRDGQAKTLYNWAEVGTSVIIN